MNDSPDNSSPSSSSSGTSREKLMENVQSLADHADALLSATASVSSEGVALARSNLTESLQAVRSQLSRLQAMAIQRARQAAQATDTYVRRNPWQAVGIAMAVGFLASVVGIFARRTATR